MKIRNTLAGIGVLVVVIGGGISAAPANAAPAAPAVASVADSGRLPTKVQTTIPPKRPATYTENFKCPLVTNTSDTWVADCTGVWYAGEPGVRTYNMRVTITQDRNTLWESVGLQWLKSLDSRQKDVRVYCQNKDGTSSALKGHYIVGGSYPDLNSLGGTGRFYCNNYSTGNPVGYIFDVAASYGSGVYHTIITVGNPWIGGVQNHYGHPERTCGC